MAVTPIHQGSGAGSALFVEAVERVRSRGAATLWAESRDTSLGFYVGHGMRAVSQRRHSTLGVS